MHISPVLWQFLVKWLHASALFPAEASTIAPYTDALYFFLLTITAIGMVLVGVLVIGFSIRYRKERQPEAVQVEGSTLLEATWTIIPLALFLVCFVWGAILYFRIYNPPTNAMNIYIVGKQWMWKAEHPGGQHEINALHVPTGRPVQLTMISQDVFHSFSIPDFRVKREVIPGRYTTVWFNATTPGTYHIFCTQYCGTLHSAMIGEVTVLSPEDYEAWTKSSTSGMSLAQNGERLFASMGCNACHSGSATSRGPNLAGVYGSKLQLTDGSQVLVNDVYLRDAILNPSQHVTSGFAPIMPTYQGQVSEDGLIDLVEYIKTLNSNYRVQQTLTTSQSNEAAPTTPGVVEAMSATNTTILNLPDQRTATMPKRNYLNNEDGLLSWLFTGDHKRIAILYLISITFFFFIGGAFAGLIRLELLTPQPDLMASDTYNKMFSMHGIVMIFLFLVPSVPATLGNFLIPIMLGAKDLAFPKINLLSWYLYLGGAAFTMAALVMGGVDTGWTFTTPLSTHYLNTNVLTTATGIFIVGFSSIFTGLNFIVTIHRMRAPGMTWFRMPLFVWAHYAASILMVLGTPVLAISLVLVALERTFGIGVFDPTKGGDPLLFQHLFWFYSHPAVYIMILPGMGVISEVISTFSRKRVFGYTAVAFSSVAIALFGFFVWEHHMFIMGVSNYSALVFSLLTMLVAVPSAIKIFNWAFTLQNGSITFETPMLYAFAFMGLFVIGGMTGVFLGALGMDIHLTETYFIVAHFHYVMVGGMLMAFSGGHPFLVAEDDGPDVSGVVLEALRRDELHRLQPDFHAAVHPRLPRDAAPLPCVSGRVPGAERASRPPARRCWELDSCCRCCTWAGR